MHVTQLISGLFPKRLVPDEDDRDAWDVILACILNDLLARSEFRDGTMAEVGRCSHWLRPHQTRWTADGGFAWPSGYGSGQGGYSRDSLPQFDWSVVLRWNGQAWVRAPKQSAKYDARIAIPARTARHAQAAVHALFMSGPEKQRRYYGFRKIGGIWHCTAGPKD